MSSSPDEHRSPVASLESKVASELRAALEGLPDGSAFAVEPSSDLAYLLELYLPHLLARRYPQWASETLDGVFVAQARKVGPDTAELVGAGLLMSDQTLTPLSVRLELAESGDEVASYHVRLGEPGGGRMRVSGPLYGRSGGFVESVVARLDDVEWVYRVEGGTVEDD
ncbi:hypothetical protein [Deinococcus pimensis]|uniref:hypothetical protein n=1 Tax=Deinococcus pimensis TaxID=309888 RepID=UPI00048121EA|nr:hypothetical protein [Deinococcus pimensis]